MSAFLRQHLFSFLIIGGSLVAYFVPGPFLEIAGFRMGRLIVPFIQVIMFGMGTTLRLADFTDILRRPWPIAVGVCLQFAVMPVLGCVLAIAAGLDGEIAAGVVLIGSAAGGVASNVMAYVAGANVALSVSMTTVSTLAAPIMTPLLMRLLAGRFIAIDMVEMALSLVQMIFLPLFASQVARLLFDRWCRKANEVIARILPTVSMTAICLIVTICTAAAHRELREAGALVFAVAVLHNGLGYVFGYWGARLFGRFVGIDERDCRTVAIEVGMQNAGMSQALAMNVLKSAGAALAPAIFGVWMDFSGSLLAGWWKRRPVRTFVLFLAVVLTASAGWAHDVDWMRGSVGVSLHWTAAVDAADGTKPSFEEAVDGFDAEGLADSLQAVGARHLIFTLAHAWQMLPMPNAALDRIAPGRTSRRDLFGEIVRACTNRGIRVIAYYNHGCNDQWQAETPDPVIVRWIRESSCPTQLGGGDMGVFSSNICAIVRDVSCRYGKGISGWWFDSAYSVDSNGPRRNRSLKGDWTFPWQALLDAARTGNPDAAVAVNGGVGVNYQYCDDTDYYAGEVTQLEQIFFPPPDGRRVDARWTCFDDTSWTFSAERGFVPPRLPLKTFAAWTRRNRDVGRMTTFNVLVDRRGRLSPEFVKLKEVFAEGNPDRPLPAEKPLSVDCGRQLFVDDALIAESNGVVRHWNRPVKVDDPVLWPGDGAGAAARGTDAEPANLTCATDGGLWWDPKIGRYRLWYQADWCGDACYAESADGTTWTYPKLDAVPGTNRLFAEDDLDSWCVVPDYAAADPYSCWRLYMSAPGGITEDRFWTSADGRRFTGGELLGHSGDRSTMYYDPFRTNWVFSLRNYVGDGIRCRSIVTAKDIGGKGSFWHRPDKPDWGWTCDPARRERYPAPGDWLTITNWPNRYLYSFSAVAYESVMLGVMEVLYKSPRDNLDGMEAGLPKQTGLHFCFSRDGRTFVPRWNADIPPSGWGSGKWDTGYLSPIGGVCVIRDERLWFYYSALRGDGRRLGQDVSPEGTTWTGNGMYSNGAIGCATLRRDGFAGMVADARGEITTKPLVFSGGHLFVNAECRFGSLAVEAIGAAGGVLPGFSVRECLAFKAKDATRTEIRWRKAKLSDLAGKSVRFRFVLDCGTLYSFWVSPSSRGESRGYVAGGGPDYHGLIDD